MKLFSMILPIQQMGLGALCFWVVRPSVRVFKYDGTQAFLTDAVDLQFVSSLQHVSESEISQSGVAGILEPFITGSKTSSRVSFRGQTLSLGPISALFAWSAPWLENVGL